MWSNEVDIMIKNAKVYNSFLKKFVVANVSVLNGKIYYIDKKQSNQVKAKKEVDASGKYMIPGLVDVHMHIESSMMVPEVFCKHLASCGVTTIVSEPHEMANVNGPKGILDMINAGANSDIDVFYGIPSSVPSTNGELETTGGEITFEDMKRLKENESVICVGEVMNYRQIIKDNDLEITKFIKYLQEEDKNFVIEGHCPSLVDLDLAKFLYLGINADHTEHNEEELLQRFENGMYVEIQEKMLNKWVLDYIEENNLYEHFGFVTDDVMADTLYEKGQLDGVVRKALNLGFSPENAVYNATYTNARRMNLRDRGAIAPGKIADFVLISDLEEFKVDSTYKNGKCIFRRNEEVYNTAVNSKKYGFSDEYYNSIHLERVDESNFVIKTEKIAPYVTVRAMKISDGSTKTEEKLVKVPVKDNILMWEQTECRLAKVFERYGKTGKSSYGFVCGDIIKSGAVATSYAHDSHNLLVVGASPKEMIIAVNEIIDLQGGIVTVSGNEITAKLQLNVGGILSDKSIKEISNNLKKVRQQMILQGYKHYNPIMSFCTLALPVSPALKITDKGLIDVVQGKIIDVIVS